MTEPSVLFLVVGLIAGMLFHSVVYNAVQWAE